MVCDGNDCVLMENTKKEVAELKDGLAYVSHQVYRILLALHVPVCQCEICIDRHRMQNDLIIQASMKNGHSTSNLCGDSSQARSDSDHCTDLDTDTMGLGKKNEEIETGQNRLSDSQIDYRSLMSQLLSSSSTSNYSGRGRPPLGVVVHSKRKLRKLWQLQNGDSGATRSKYCSLSEQRSVADFAEKYGPTAASRKFGVSSAIASYYHKKMYKKYKTGTSILGLDQDNRHPPTMVTREQLPNGVESIVTVQDDQKPSTSNGDGPPLSLSPSCYLRGGRTRGRPKLIGDELDAELVDHLINYKRNLMTRHRLTASLALKISTDYIKTKEPGLLEEDGGVIRLKLTWAMKLCSRVLCKEKELYPQCTTPTTLVEQVEHNHQNENDVIRSDLACRSSSLVPSQIEVL